jgi:DNA-binding CsgD family transcriptional regulator
MYDPMAVVWADAIETLTGLGELDQAGAQLAQYEEHARSMGSPWGVAAASRCRALLAAKQDDLGVAVDAAKRALAELDGLAYPLERARALLVLGMVRRQAQQKKPARDALEQAVAILDALGARLWAARARDELARISGRRPAADDELTSTEHQVAVLAAQGRSNKEIAAELYMGVSTVEAHLSTAYRKTGVRRAELGAWLTAQGDGANPTATPPQT